VLQRHCKSSDPQSTESIHKTALTGKTCTPREHIGVYTYVHTSAVSFASGFFLFHNGTPRRAGSKEKQNPFLIPTEPRLTYLHARVWSPGVRIYMCRCTSLFSLEGEIELPHSEFIVEMSKCKSVSRLGDNPKCGDAEMSSAGGLEFLSPLGSFFLSFFPSV